MLYASALTKNQQGAKDSLVDPNGLYNRVFLAIASVKDNLPDQEIDLDIT